ncbi:response regulator transcription factor [bacterium]|nr:response regulator transcription factor [bacterium]
MAKSKDAGHKGTVVIVEDDPGIAESVAYTLGQEGFRTISAADGPTGLAEALAGQPDLVILDLMLPGMDGLDVFRALRKHSTVPVIMLTAKASESDRVAGIEMGADDYIVKPFYMRELVARVKMVLRRAQAGAEPSEEVLRVRGISIDRARRTVTAGDREVTLTPQEFALLECLARNHGRALTREVILQQAWGESEYIDPRTVDVHIRWLREKLEDDPSAPQHILTVRGVGYKMAE